MNIYLMAGSVSQYGGVSGNIGHLAALIEEELEQAGFKSSFDEFWLTLNYPATHIFPSIEGMLPDFKTKYDLLPYSRVNRKLKKIDLILKAPEFSEYFDKAGTQYKGNPLEIEDQYKNISEAELARILIDKYRSAGELIASKLKKEDEFDFATYNSVLAKIRECINDDFLRSTSADQQTKAQDAVLRKILQEREERKAQNRPKDKLIRDLRVYAWQLPERALSPYDYQYSEIFLSLLKKHRLMCPVYNYIYIQVGTTMEAAIAEARTMESWHENGVAVIDYDNYQAQPEAEKEKIVFRAICDGLKDIALIDKLDMTIIDNVIAIISEKGLNTELTHKKTGNSKQ